MEERPMRLYRTSAGPILECDGYFCPVVNGSWDELITSDDVENQLRDVVAHSSGVETRLQDHEILAPIGSQEVWAAGVTYFRSRDARMEESKSVGGGDFYDRVYNAERPELFFKATASRVVGHGGEVAIRRDARWSVPEPELVLLVSPRGRILGYTIGANPLYLPQAKVYYRSCALGPAILISSSPLSQSTVIRMEILRAGATAFSGQVTLGSIKRDLQSLVHFLYRDNVFPAGCFLFTGTGIVPPDSFTLATGDEIHIGIDSIGTLVNTVAQNS
jgi:2-dehydro-3-deoxy-D-arabinonate dehydratase